MVWTILSLLSLILLGGFISYYGDLQGRRWGKRKVSWFGMRPKHTAILITSLTGAFISLLSVLTLLLIAPTVRDVVIHGERAIEENKRLNTDYKEQIYKSGKLIHESQKALAMNQQALTLTKGQLSVLQAQVIPLNKSLENLKQENGKIEKANEQLGHQNMDLGHQNSQLTANKKDLTRQIAELAQKQVGLQHNVKVLEQTNNTQLKANQEQIRADQKIESELKARKAELAQVSTKLDQAYTSLANSGQFFSQNYAAVRQGKVCVRAGSELARYVFGAHMRPDAVKKQISDLLRNASDKAHRYGAGVGENGRAVRIVSKLLFTTTGEESAHEKDSIEALAESIAGADTAVVVVARAVSNTLEGEQVNMDLDHPRAVRTIFQTGTVLAMQHIDANQSIEGIKQAIAQFLQTDVRAAALSAGIIAQADPVTGVSQVGLYDSIDLGIIAVKAEQLKGDVVLKAITIAPTTSADLLDHSHLHLDVSRAQ